MSIVFRLREELAYLEGLGFNSSEIFLLAYITEETNNLVSFLKKPDQNLL